MTMSKIGLALWTSVWNRQREYFLLAMFNANNVRGIFQHLFKESKDAFLAKVKLNFTNF